MTTKIFIALIAFYQRWLSPLKGPSCRFYPSCSTYALQAFEKYGAFRALLMTVWRVARCHPFHPGGYDPVR